MPNSTPSIVWFRQDLRVAENPALAYAAANGPVLPLYVLDNNAFGGRPLGGASRWWLHKSLEALAKKLGGLTLIAGDPAEVIPELAEKTGIRGIYWNRCYEPHAVRRDTQIKTQLCERGFDVASFNGSLLFEPWQTKTLGGSPFKVYSPFWRSCLKGGIGDSDVKSVPPLTIAAGGGDNLADWNLLPHKPNWAAGFENEWIPGEEGARQKLYDFLDAGLEGYSCDRNRPDLPKVSRLSPHLHWGEISPRQVWRAVQAKMAAEPALTKDADKFLSEIGWREFAYHLLYHFPTLPHKNWKAEFDAYPWQSRPDLLFAWQQGKTGYPMVDAGMRELWHTGYMHNRVRMVVASFLIKHLRIDWREGERWFWDTLVDADVANNSASWQWVAGSGADAAPYFRIFNPTEQGRKFDPDGAYVRKWCPELARLPIDFIHAPHEAPAEVLRQAGVELGQNYPAPLVNHREARAAALSAYQSLKRD